MTYTVTLAPHLTKRTITLGDGEYHLTQGQKVEGAIYDTLAVVYPSIFSSSEAEAKVIDEVVKKVEPKEELLIETPVPVKAEKEVEIEVPEVKEVKETPVKKAVKKTPVKKAVKKVAKKDTKED